MTANSLERRAPMITTTTDPTDAAYLDPQWADYRSARDQYEADRRRVESGDQLDAGWLEFNLNSVFFDESYARHWARWVATSRCRELAAQRGRVLAAVRLYEVGRKSYRAIFNTAARPSITITTTQKESAS
jgi:hypothetical protein